jgi:cation diffusion facilitator CzcD-associated flavoprotein CzcO
MHSARWDWSYSLEGKKVAIIGVGSTAAQIVPEVAKVAKSLTVYQRTPNWIVPRLDKAIPKWKRVLYRYLPVARWQKRSAMMLFRENTFHTVVEPASNNGEMFEQLCLNHLKTQIPSRPDLWAKLRPNYKPGCKRVVVSDQYYPVFLLDHVKLETRNIERITATGIMVDGTAEEEYDLIILATGFRTVDFMHPIEVRGRARQPLVAIWKDGPEAFYGVCVDQLPNFALMYGPNTNLSHNSIILMIEAQSRYITALVKKVLEGRLAGDDIVIQPKAQKVKEYNERLQSELAKTNYADPNCNSWYKLPGSGKITNNWSRTAIEYQKVSLKFNASNLSSLKDVCLASKQGRLVGL